MAKRQSIYMPDTMKDFIASYGENSLSGSIATQINLNYLRGFFFVYHMGG